MASNRILEEQINVRTELWGDYIYHLPFNEYCFPTYDGKGQFIPLPRRFQEIIEEFQKKFTEQEEEEKKEYDAHEKVFLLHEEIVKLLGKIGEKNDFLEISKEVIILIEQVGDFNNSFAFSQQEIKKFLEKWIGKEDIKENVTNLDPDAQVSLNSTIHKGQEWKSINRNFTPKLVEGWVNRGFSYEKVKDWIDIRSLSKQDEVIKEYEFTEWLVNYKKGNYADPMWWLNYSPEGEMEKIRKEYDIFEEIKAIPELKEIEEKAKEFETNLKLAERRINSCFIKEDNEGGICFVYQPPNGNFPALDKFLWFRNNVFYETKKENGWRRINHKIAEIRAVRSKFIHTYLDKNGWALNGGQGVLTYYPKNVLGATDRDEPCTTECSSFIDSNEYIEFESEWQPKYQLFKLKNMMMGFYRSDLVNKLGRYPAFHTLDLEKVDAERETRAWLQPTTYFFLPDWYEEGMMACTPPPNGLFKTTFASPSGIELGKWLQDLGIERGKENGAEHLLRHIHVNYFWNDEKKSESTLEEMDWENFRIEPTANPAGILYRFKSGRVVFRYSEDLNFTLDANKIASASVSLGAKIADSLIKFKTGGNANINVDDLTKRVTDNIVKEYLHTGKAEKNQTETQGQRKKTLASGSQTVASTLLGSVPTILDISHTHGDYTLAELALRMNSIQFKIGLSYNRNLFDWYFSKKSLRKPCHLVFNQQRIGDIFCKGFIKMEEGVFFEGDPDGYYAKLMTKGMNFYEKTPKEIFIIPLKNTIHRSETLNDKPILENTSITENYSTAIGRDDKVHIDDRSWVWKNSYCRPTSGGKDIFPDLIDQMKANIKPRKEKAINDVAWTFDGIAKGRASVTVAEKTEYEWFINAFSTGQKSSLKFTGIDKGVEVVLTQNGAVWSLDIIGRVKVKKTFGDPSSIGKPIRAKEIPQKLKDMKEKDQFKGVEEFNEKNKALADKAKRKELTIEKSRDRSKDKAKEENKTKDQQKNVDRKKIRIIEVLPDKDKKISKDKPKEQGKDERKEKNL